MYQRVPENRIPVASYGESQVEVASCKKDRILLQEPPRCWIIVAGAVVIEPALAVKLPACIRIRLLDGTRGFEDIPVRIVAVALGCHTHSVGQISHRTQPILVIEEGAAALRHRNRFIDARPVGIAGLQRVRSIVFQQNIFPIIDVAFRLAIRHLFDAATEAIVPIGAAERGRGIARHEVFDFHESIFWIVAVLRVGAGREERLPRQIPIVVVLIRMSRVRRELVPGVRHVACGGSVPHGIIGE